MRRWLAHALLLGALTVAAGCASSPTPKGPTSDEKSAHINTQLGVAYMRQGEFQQALEKLQKAVRQNPQLAEAHAASAVLYERLNEPEKAMEHHRRAVELAPEDSAALNNYGRFLCGRKQFDKAETYFQRAAQNPLYRTPEVPLANAASCAENAGQNEKAEQYFLRALQANPKFPFALLRMADRRQQGGHALSARGFYQRYLAVAPQTAESLWIGIQIEQELGDQSALGSYALLLKGKFPDSEEARRLIEAEKRNGR